MSNSTYDFRISDLPAGRQVLDFRFILFALLISSCSSNSGKSNTTSVKFEQYYVKGEELYFKHCSNCHQANGTGLGLVYPPLNSSDYMEKNFESVLCLMKHGIEGQVMVNGKDFSQPMPGVSALTSLEIAEIATYIYNTWDHKKGIVEADEVSKIMQACEIK